MITLVDQSDPQDVKKKRGSGLEHICSHNPLRLPVIKRRLAVYSSVAGKVVKACCQVELVFIIIFFIVISLSLLLYGGFLLLGSLRIAITRWLKCLEMVLR